MMDKMMMTDKEMEDMRKEKMKKMMMASKNKATAVKMALEMAKEKKGGMKNG